MWWGAAVVTALISWYLAVMVAVAAGLWLVCLSVSARRETAASDLWLRALQLMCAALLAFAVLLPFAAPFLDRSSEAGETAAYAAAWQSYLVPHEHTTAGRWLVSRGWATPQGLSGERSLFLGWGMLALAVVGAASAISSSEAGDRRRIAFLLVLVTTAATLSFGPSVSGFAPFDLIAMLPGASAFRATARFGLLVTLGCALLAAYGLAWLRRSRPRLRVLLTVAALALIVAESYVIDAGGVPQPERMPEIYTLALNDEVQAAVALPMYAGETFWFLEADYLLYSTSAQFIRLANGFGRWAPAPYLDIGRAARAFPSADTAAVLRAYGITHVLLHGARFGRGFGDVLNKLREAPDFTIVATRERDVLVRVN
jgi:hypothetical protein